MPGIHSSLVTDHLGANANANANASGVNIGFPKPSSTMGWGNYPLTK